MAKEYSEIMGVWFKAIRRQMGYIRAALNKPEGEAPDGAARNEMAANLKLIASELETLAAELLTRKRKKE